MINDALRARFEAAYSAEFLPSFSNVFQKHNNGDYANFVIQKFWRVYQLGHAAGMEDAAVVCAEMFPKTPPYALHLEIAHECAEEIRAKAKGEQ